MADLARQKYDVIVVGSGAAGGWACKRLAEAGLKVALLEAGRPQSNENFSEHTPPFELKYRNLAPEILRRLAPFKCRWGTSARIYPRLVRQRYRRTLHHAGRQAIQLAGPFAHYRLAAPTSGRVSLRLGEQDFKAASHDGYGEDWPISYKDIAPYYDLVDRYVGITGMAEGLEELPDGQFQPPMPLNCQESVFRSRLKEKMGLTATLARSATLTRPLNGRSACHYCGPCERGCMTESYFNSAFTTVADAPKSGNCTLISNAMAFKVLMVRPTALAAFFTSTATRARRAKFTLMPSPYARFIAGIRPHPF